MTKYDIRISRSLDEARELWENIISPRSIYDLWDFRYLFFKHFDNEPLFIIAEIAGEPVSFLPLQKSGENGRIEFFGGFFMEDNRAVCRPGHEDSIPFLYRAVPENDLLKAIISDNDRIKADFYEYKYVLYLDRFSNGEDFINNNFSKKSSANLKKKIRKINELGPDIIVNNFSDLELMYEMNICSFRDESIFKIPHFPEIFKELTAQKFEPLLLSFLINGRVEAVSLSLCRGDYFTYLNSGTNKKDYPNLGSFLIYKNIEYALDMKKGVFDAGIEDLGWKERWHLSKISQYKYKNQKN